MSVEMRIPVRALSPERPGKGLPSCVLCPVCGTEECLVLEELGTLCGTMSAAQLASREDVSPPVARKPAAA